MDFNVFGKAVSAQFKEMTKHDLYRSKVDKDKLWETYLGSFPAGTNPIYKERTEHDCNCCKGFIRNAGPAVAIVDGKIVTIWDIKIDDPAYQAVADSMAALVRAEAIDNIFLHVEPVAGASKTLQQLLEGGTRSWDHFFINFPTTCVLKGDHIGPRLSDSRATHDVFLRGLKEITLESVDTVIDLIAQNSLYRGEEHLAVVKEFKKFKTPFDKLPKISGEEGAIYASKEQDLFVWKNMRGMTGQSVSRIRNTAIGTLLTDLSEGVDLEDAVKSFESKVAPTNYKRPTALVTKGMIQKAQAKIEEMGFTSALERRYATPEDITINNILFANRESKKAMNVFDDLARKVPEKTRSLDKIEEVPIEKFLSDILPKAESLEVFFENSHSGNLVSLIAPVDPTAKNMFKWDNNFSWSYAGELTDSIKERVKRAGGKIDGDFRASLSWFNYDDLDLHLVEPNSNKIFYGSKISPYTRGQLDVDMNAGGGGPGRGSRSAVENIFYSDRKTMAEGTYSLKVHNYHRVETSDVGFDVEMEFDGTVYSFGHPTAIANGDTLLVAKFKYHHKDGITILESMPSKQTSKTVWNVPTQTFQKVNVVMHSPNHWDDKVVGNKHYFFMLNDCLNEEKARGFFNEFLTPELNEHRKVFEMVGAKMKTEESSRQLSGLGFSSTQRNHLLCRIKGSFQRTVKITF